ncbi:MAG: Serine/threonine-protein kinase PknD [Mycoplasmataceae bacterium]|nr:Serine/threonine-protein kinase PknD [Mycoplasmataceae bacterium]WNE40705.1 MAG: Serine/threonine-protein kinase PknD [Mycoplasmataceae bacterium]
MVLASEYLEKNYPKEGVCLIDNCNKGKKRNEIIRLEISEQKLSETLDLSDFIKLEELYCSINEISKIILPTGNRLKVLDCINNRLTDFDYTNLKPESLVCLMLLNNKLLTTNIEVFSQFINLKRLEIGNGERWVRAGQGNKFFGSLESLRNLKWLSNLNILNTNINQGFEYLPESLEIFNYAPIAEPDCQVREIAKEINVYWDNWKNLIFWKRKGFAIQEIRLWIEKGLAPNDYLFAYYLQKDGYQPNDLNKNNIEEVRKKCSWKDIHQDFNFQNREKWEEADFTYQVIKEWIELGFEPNEPNQTYQIWQNKDKNLNYKKTKAWLEAGLKTSEAELAIFLENRGYKVNNPKIGQMINHESWREINSKFTYPLRKDWEKKNLTYQETQKWFELGFEPNQSEFAQKWKELNLEYQEIKEWMKSGFSPKDYQKVNDWKKLGIKETKVWLKAKFSKGEYQEVLKWKSKGFAAEEVNKLIVAGAKKDDYNLINKWEEKKFTVEQIKEWINAGAKLDNYDFVAWLRDIKKETPIWITNYQADYRKLSENFKKYGLCSDCHQPYTGEEWCRDCNSQRLRVNFSNWTSGNSQIDEFIQNLQLQATEANKFLEWIPYEQFTNIEFLAQGGFGKVYKAWWTEGNVQYWDREKNQWQRKKEVKEKDLKNIDLVRKIRNLFSNKNEYLEVVFKIIDNSRTSNNFLDEVAKHKIIDDWFNNLVPCYGISQDPETGDYLMIMRYLPERDLRNYLKNNNQDLKRELTKKKRIEHEIKKLGLEKEQLDNKKETLTNNHQKIRSILDNFVDYGREKEELSLLIKNLPNKKKEFLKKLDDIKLGLSKAILYEELTTLYLTKLGLDNLEAKKKEKEKSLEEQKKNFSELQLRVINFQTNKISQLTNIVQGLKDIHQKNLVHRDFHSGNILKGIKQTECLITDLGLCKPTNESSQAEKIYGVLPYVAPEVLQGQPYTQAADVYSFGIIAYELLSGLPPHYDRAYDVQLGVDICRGLRPRFQIEIPKFLENLINHCWSNDPAERPTAHGLEKVLRIWQEDEGFKKQIKDAEEINKNLSLEVRFPDYQIHYGVDYHSKLLPTQRIIQIIQTNNLSTSSTLFSQSSNTIILPTKQIAQLAQDQNQQQQSLILEIKKMEQEIGKSLTKEQKELVSGYIKNQKKYQENKKDKETKKEIEKVEEQLEQENFTNEEIEKIISYCKRFVKSEQKLEKEKLEAQVLQLDIKN